STNIFIQGHSYSGPRSGDEIYQVTVWPTFFETMGIPLMIGRAYTDRDDEKAPKVAIINETAARKYFGNENPVGRRFGNRLESPDQGEVIGVVVDARYNSLREAVPPTVYWAFTQRCCPGATFAVRTATDPAGLTKSVREAIQQVDANLPLMNITTQTES